MSRYHLSGPRIRLTLCWLSWQVTINFRKIDVSLNMSQSISRNLLTSLFPAVQSVYIVVVSSLNGSNKGGPPGTRRLMEMFRKGRDSKIESKLANVRNVTELKQLIKLILQGRPCHLRKLNRTEPPMAGRGFARLLSLRRTPLVLRPNRTWPKVS